MLVGIFSDTHLGFGKDDRFDEAFLRVKEALNFFMEKKVDFIVHAGDLFDEATPTQETWLRSFDAFGVNSGPARVITKHTMNGDSSCLVKGIPIVAIHGTHEHRGKDFANALDVLENGNCLAHIHAGYVEFTSASDEKIYVHGLGGVPEKHAHEVLLRYSPKPINGGTNMLLLHQSFKEFLPFDDDENVASLSLSDLPAGFDLIINGHLHWTNEQTYEGKRFLLTGSTIFTQMKKLESEKQKGMFLFDTITKKIEFVPFSPQRKLIYEKLSFTSATPKDVTDTVAGVILNILAEKYELKPLIRIKLTGSLAKGFTQSDINIVLPIERAIFSVSKDFSTESFQKKMEGLKQIQALKKSVVDVGIDILEKNVEDAKIENFDTRRMFELLSASDLEKAEEVLLQK